MKEIIIARSWREFDKQQFVAVCEILRVFKDRTLKIHLNINGDVNDSYVEAIRTNLKNDSELIIYNNTFLDEFARSHEVSLDKINEFPQWEWIYHILLYYYLYENQVSYVLTYDDDILFRTSNIGEVLHNLDYEIPFSICDQYYDADKCMMGKLCENLGAWVADEYFACNSNDMPTNSGFMGFKPESIFKPFSDLNQIVSLFIFKKWDHHTMQGTGYDTYKILLQEQSFLSIMSRATSNRSHIVLHKGDGYFVTSNVDEINLSNILHYVGTLKYEDVYLNRVDALYSIYKSKYFN